LGWVLSLWWVGELVGRVGLGMGNMFVPLQAAAFATITPAATGRASTMFNAVRQLGGAIGVAVLTSAIVAVGPMHLVSGHLVANVQAYPAAFAVATAFALAALPFATRSSDADAAPTLPAPPPRPPPRPPAPPA